VPCNIVQEYHLRDNILVPLFVTYLVDIADGGGGGKEKGRHDWSKKFRKAAKIVFTFFQYPAPDCWDMAIDTTSTPHSACFYNAMIRKKVYFFLGIIYWKKGIFLLCLKVVLVTKKNFLKTSLA
jgi:hypothetical protein